MYNAYIYLYIFVYICVYKCMPQRTTSDRRRPLTNACV